MNILLTSMHIERSPQAVPLAPALLKSSLMEMKGNHSVSIMEFYIHETVSSWVKRIKKENPRCVGFSVYLWNREHYMELARALKKEIPGIIIFAGGAEVTAGRKSLLKAGIDYTLTGEGEEIIKEFISSLNNPGKLKKIPGVNSSHSRYIKDLNTIPSPLLKGVLNLKDYDGFLWELSRGCPFSCDFCFESRGHKGVRQFSMKRVEQELDLIIKNSVDQVFVLDPTFNKDLKRAKDILQLILKKNRGTHFHFEVRSEFLDRESAELFAALGSSLQIGLQSAHNRVLKNINRTIKKEKFTAKIQLLNEAGAIFGLDLIYGLPGDNYTGFKESMDFALSLQPNHLDIFPLAVLPGTVLADKERDLGITRQTQPPYTVIKTESFSKEDMKKAESLTEACNYVYNRGKSTGWLLPVTSTLGLSFTDFFEKFLLWSQKEKRDLHKKGKETETVTEFIKTFKNPLEEVILDLIEYHNAYSRALLGKKPSFNKIDKFTAVIQEAEEIKAVLPPGTHLSRFFYNFIEVLESGITDIEVISGFFQKEETLSVTWFHPEEGVLTDTFSPVYMEVLETIGKKEKLLHPSPEVREFLVYALVSGMITLSE